MRLGLGLFDIITDILHVVDVRYVVGQWHKKKFVAGKIWCLSFKSAKGTIIVLGFGACPPEKL